MSQINFSNITSERFDTVAPRITRLPVYAINQLNQSRSFNNVSALIHPLYANMEDKWSKWRITYEGGDEFIERFVKQFSGREEIEDFNERKAMTPVGAFATSAINEIKNAIFQRMSDVTRKDGSDNYTSAVKGEKGGVDLRGASMNWFIGDKILPELLVMGKVGVFVDNFQLSANESLASIKTKHPYFYTYRAEDIRSWAYGTYGAESDYIALLLRDYNYVVDQATQLPIAEVPTFRFIWLAEDKKVHIQFYDQAGNPNSEEITLNINKIPFVMFEISDSLLKNVANHQISITNMESSDVNFIHKGNFGFYTEQWDPGENSQYLKAAKARYTEVAGGPGVQYITDPTDMITRATAATGLPVLGEDENEVIVGSAQGRKYAKDMDRPGFIAPPTGPILASMSKQASLKNDIRDLIHLSLANTRSQASSAQSKQVDQQGLEAGLSYIGIELAHGENKLAEHWAMYENSEPASVHYPSRYNLKSPEQITTEIDQRIKLRDQVNSPTYKKENTKEIARLSLQTTVSDDILDTINDEIDGADYYTSDPKTIQEDVKAGLVDVDRASTARGWPKGAAKDAKGDHAERLARIQDSQMQGALQRTALKNDENSLTNPASRGVPDLSGDPSGDAASEKEGKPQRGEGT